MKDEETEGTALADDQPNLDAPATDMTALGLADDAQDVPSGHAQGQLSQPS